MSLVGRVRCVGNRGAGTFANFYINPKLFTTHRETLGPRERLKPAAGVLACGGHGDRITPTRGVDSCGPRLWTPPGDDAHIWACDGQCSLSQRCVGDVGTLLWTHFVKVLS